MTSQSSPMASSSKNRMASCELKIQVILIISICCLLAATSSQAFDDDLEDINHTHHHDQHSDQSSDPKSMPKDKILLKDVKTLVFERNKRTTSRRTHPIHQLSCVGGTAGCRLFTPNVSSSENQLRLCNHR